MLLLFAGQMPQPSSKLEKNGSQVADDGRGIVGRLGESSALVDEDVGGGGIVVDVDRGVERDGGDEESQDMTKSCCPERTWWEDFQYDQSR